MLYLAIDDSSDTPVYRQIVDAIRHQIAAGEVPPGQSLPSIRELAEHLQVNVNTVHKAYLLLQDMGVIVIRRARGAMVAPGIEDVLGSARNRDLLVEKTRDLVAEAIRLGFSARDVVLAIQSLEGGTPP